SIAAVPVLTDGLAVFERHEHIDRKDRFPVPANDHRRLEMATVAAHTQLLDSIIEHVGAAIDLVEKWREVAARHFGRCREEVLRLRVSEFPAREVCGHDALERRPSEQSLERVEP